MRITPLLGGTGCAAQLSPGFPRAGAWPRAGRRKVRPTCSPFPPPPGPGLPAPAELRAPPRPPQAGPGRRRGGRAAHSGKPGARPQRSRPCRGRRPAEGRPPRRRHPPHPHRGRRGYGLLRRREAAAGRGAAVLLRAAIARLGLGALHGYKEFGRLPPRRR